MCRQLEGDTTAARAAGGGAALSSFKTPDDSLLYESLPRRSLGLLSLQSGPSSLGYE